MAANSNQSLLLSLVYVSGDILGINLRTSSSLFLLHQDTKECLCLAPMFELNRIVPLEQRRYRLNAWFQFFSIQLLIAHQTTEKIFHGPKIY